MAKADTKEEKKDEANGAAAAEGKELAVQGPKDIAEMSDEELAAEMAAESAVSRQEIGLSDIRLPALALVQATSGYVSDGKAKPGQLIHTLTEEVFDEVEVILVRMNKTRTLFGKEIGSPPECSSPNAADGYGDPGDSLEQRGPNGGGACASCPEAQWRSGGRCQLRYNYVAVLLGPPDRAGDRDWENELPVGFLMHGTSAKIATQLNTMVMEGQFMWSAVVKLFTKADENEKGKFRVWQVSKGSPASQEQMVHAFKKAKQLRTATNVTVVGADGRTGEGSGSASDDSDIPF